MNDKDIQELAVLKVRLQQLQIDAHQVGHELIQLRAYAAKQDQYLSTLLKLLGLLPADLDAPGALTTKATLLLRLSRPEN